MIDPMLHPVCVFSPKSAGCFSAAFLVTAATSTLGTVNYKEEGGTLFAYLTCGCKPVTGLFANTHTDGQQQLHKTNNTAPGNNKVYLMMHCLHYHK